MVNAIVTPDQDSVVAEIDILAPPERVFAAISDAEQLKHWWISPICDQTFWNLDPRPGGKWGFATTPARESINGVKEFKCRGEILEWVPPRLLVYSWIANWNDQPEAVTVVRWELTPIPTGTRVKVTHSGLAQQPTTRELYRGGWPGVIQNLQKYLEKRVNDGYGQH
jgi:uncharacterized protein YndB with AHSA1/START domain